MSSNIWYNHHFFSVQVMYDDSGVTSFVPKQSSVVSHQMPDCTHLFLDHLQLEKLLLSHLGLVVVLEVAEIMVRPHMPFT